MTGGLIDTFGEYVKMRLQGWGDEFALHRDCEYLGHQSKNILQVLIDHKGEMPGRAVGFKPLEIPLDALEIEGVIGEIARDQPIHACVMRAYYCGSGRRKVERYEIAKGLIARVVGASRHMSVRAYMGLHEDGVLMVRGALIACGINRR